MPDRGESRRLGTVIGDDDNGRRSRKLANERAETSIEIDQKSIEDRTGFSDRAPISGDVSDRRSAELDRQLAEWEAARELELGRQDHDTTDGEAGDA